MYLYQRISQVNECNYLLLKYSLLDIFRAGSVFPEELKSEIVNRFEYLIYWINEESRKFLGFMVRELELAILELGSEEYEEVTNSLKGLLIYFRNKSHGLQEIE